MDLHAFLIGIILSLVSVVAHATMSRMDHLTQLVYQSPVLAQQEIAELESELTAQSAPSHTLRLQLLKCQQLVQQGEYQAAIQLAAFGQVDAKKHGLEQVIPYFNACAAEGHAKAGDLKTAMPLLEKGIAQSKQFKQPQALVSLLRLRGQFDIEQENYLQAMEDLRLALDVADEMFTQEQNWSWPPYSYLLATMGNLLYVSGDQLQALQYANQALEQADAKGKVRHLLLLNAAYLSRKTGDGNTSDKLLQQARQTLPSAASPIEKAFSYVIIAAIETDKGNYSTAERLTKESLGIFTRYRSRLSIMQANRLLARINFAVGNDTAAIEYTQAAINTAQQMDQQSYLHKLYLGLSEHYAQAGQHKLAYENLQSAFNAANQANKQLSDIRFIQYKARLSRDLQQPQTLESQSAFMLPLDWMLVLVMLGVVLPATCLYLLIYRKQKGLGEDKINRHAPIHYQVLELAMNNARNAQQPLTILVFGISPTITEDLPTLEQKIKSKLRELDKLVYLSTNSLMVILPGTSQTGGQQVMDQLVERIEPWRRHAMVSVGVASMQQFDTSTSLVKRALASQASRMKSEDVKLVQAGARL